MQMQLTVYGVAICDDAGNPISFYDGRDYSEDPKQMKIFPEGQLLNARTEQGSHQRFEQREVRVLKFSLVSQVSNLPPVPSK